MRVKIFIEVIAFDVSPVVMFLSFGLIGSHTIVMPRLLAHELAHLLGSDHDGEAPWEHNKHGLYKGMVPCPRGKALMSATVGLFCHFCHFCPKRYLA